ncbi:hypothetical protein JS510_00695 [Mycoplasma tauri]|uniref:hypothetical protein n=1 Tax=Mycoplasma tauri TaxID=547987 RepID=UPI0019687EA8|nr:hypothetical protein [Mycoplasma tauri]QSB07633.1 hypothetical protein JS510_00695 [Mycoplasma tauri]
MKTSLNIQKCNIQKIIDRLIKSKDAREIKNGLLGLKNKKILVNREKTKMRIIFSFLISCLILILFESIIFVSARYINNYSFSLFSLILILLLVFNILAHAVLLMIYKTRFKYKIDKKYVKDKNLNVYGYLEIINKCLMIFDLEIDISSKVLCIKNELNILCEKENRSE